MTGIIAGGMSGKERQLFIAHQRLFSKTSGCQINWKACGRQS